MSESFDAIVVGASVAGCTAAIFLARKGARVLLLERATDMAAYKKTCTHYIQPCASPTLERLGLTKDIAAVGGVPNVIDAWTPCGWVEYAIDETGWNIRRETLDPMLRKLAASTKGVELRMGQSVKALVHDGDRVVGVVARKTGAGKEDHDGAGSGETETRELRAKIVVGADGRHSKVAEMAGIAAKTSPNNRFIYLAYYEDVKLRAGRSHLWFMNPDTGYCFPNDGGVTCVVVMPEKSKLPEFRADMDGAFARYFDRAARGPNLREAKRVSDFFGMIEIPNHIRAAAKNGVALVGDAAMTSDPIMGVGVGWALQTGEWLADDIGAALVGSDAPDMRAIDATLATYAAHHQARLAKHHETINQMSLAKPFNAIERMVFGAAVRDRAFARDFARFTARISHPDEMITLGNLARAAWIRATKKPVPGAVEKASASP